MIHKPSAPLPPGGRINCTGAAARDVEHGLVLRSGIMHHAGIPGSRRSTKSHCPVSAARNSARSCRRWFLMLIWPAVVLVFADQAARDIKILHRKRCCRAREDLRRSSMTDHQRHRPRRSYRSRRKMRSVSIASSSRFCIANISGVQPRVSVWSLVHDRLAPCRAVEDQPAARAAVGHGLMLFFMLAPGP